RNPAWQADQLARPLVQRRAFARQVRAQSAGMHAQRAPADWVDVDSATASAWMSAANSRGMIHGHTHRPAHQTWAGGFERHVLSDWELDHGSTPRAEVLRWQRGGLRRITPDAAVTAPA